jgi:hypothetical protein
MAMRFLTLMRYFTLHKPIKKATFAPVPNLEAARGMQILVLQQQQSLCASRGFCLFIYCTCPYLYQVLFSLSIHNNP